MRRSFAYGIAALAMLGLGSVGIGTLHAWDGPPPPNFAHAPRGHVTLAFGRSLLIVGDQFDALADVIEPEGLRAGRGVSRQGALSSVETRVSIARFPLQVLGYEASAATGRKRIWLVDEDEDRWRLDRYSRVVALRYQTLSAGLILRRWRSSRATSTEAFVGLRYTFQWWHPEITTLQPDRDVFRSLHPAMGWYGGLRFYEYNTRDRSTGLQLEYSWDPGRLSGTEESFGAHTFAVHIIIGFDWPRTPVLDEERYAQTD